MSEGSAPARYCIACGAGLVRPADPALSPACPRCGWFLPTRALPVALVLAHSTTGRIVYTRQKGWPDGAWGLVAGFVEAGETAEAAALRELHEETGLAGKRPQLLRTLAFGDRLLLVIDVEVEDVDPRAGSDVERAMLATPDLELTPAEWPAHAIVAEFIGRQRSGIC